MATINKDLAEQIMANDGYYEDDPRVYAVVRYTNRFNNEFSYAIVYSFHELTNYAPSEYIIEPTVVWLANE